MVRGVYLLTFSTTNHSPPGKHEKAPTMRGIFLNISLFGQRPYLPDPCGSSTSGAEELNCRVRDGNGCGLLAMATRIENRGAPSALIVAQKILGA